MGLPGHVPLLEKLYKRRDDAGPLLARVHVGRAAILERAGDLDQAAALYRQAALLAPADLVVLSALVDFHADMRHWDEAVAAIERFGQGPGASEADRIAALMRQAAIHADCELEPLRAIAVLHRVLELDPTHQDAYYLLAQQHFLVARYAEARAAIDRVIELATSPVRSSRPRRSPATTTTRAGSSTPRASSRRDAAVPARQRLRPPATRRRRSCSRAAPPTAATSATPRRS